MKITNKSRGPRGVQTKTGLVYLDPGQSRDLDVAGGNIDRLRVNGDFIMGDRDDAVRDIIAGLGKKDFTKAGKPEVDAINAALPGDHEPVTAEDRDRIFGEMNDG